MVLKNYYRIIQSSRQQNNHIRDNRQYSERIGHKKNAMVLRSEDGTTEIGVKVLLARRGISARP